MSLDPYKANYRGLTALDVAQNAANAAGKANKAQLKAACDATRAVLASFYDDGGLPLALETPEREKKLSLRI